MPASDLPSSALSAMAHAAEAPVLSQDIDPVLVLTLATIAFFCLAFTLSLWALRQTGVPVYSAAPWIIRMAIDMLQLEDGERFCDLGCGLGRVLRSARRAAKVKATGYELNPFAILYSWALGVTDLGIHVKWRDFRKADLSGFDAVYLYLIPKVLPGLSEQLERQLKPGSRVVSVDFPIPGWQSKEEKEQGQKIWLYVMGEHRAQNPPVEMAGTAAGALVDPPLEKAP